MVSESCIPNAWIEFDRSKFEDDPIFIDIIDWVKDDDIKNNLALARKQLW